MKVSKNDCIVVTSEAVKLSDIEPCSDNESHILRTSPSQIRVYIDGHIMSIIPRLERPDAILFVPTMRPNTALDVTWLHTPRGWTLKLDYITES